MSPRSSQNRIARKKFLPDLVMTLTFTFALTLGPAFLSGARAQDLRLLTDDVWPRSTAEGRGFEDLILKEAFRRAGLGLAIEFTPSERALVNVNRGLDDGLFTRIAGLEAAYPNLVMVPEVLCRWDFAAFGAAAAGTVSRWEDLAAHDVAYIRGWKMVEANVKGRSITPVRDDEALFEMLDKGRVDVIVYEALEGRVRIKEKGLEAVKSLGPPLASVDMYLYLSVEHHDLVPRITAALREMKADGTWKRIIDSVTAGY